MVKEKSEMKDDNIKKKPSKLRRFLYVLAWAAALPVVVGIPALIIIGNSIGLSVSNITDNSSATQAIYYIELALFLSVVGIVLIIQLVRWILRTRKHLFPRVGSKVLGAYMWLGIIVTGSFMVIITSNPGIAKPPVNRDANLMNMVNVVGGKEELLNDVSIKYVDGYENENQQGEYQPVLDDNGKFAYGTITIKKGIDSNSEKTYVAHEYLHHIWETGLDYQTQHDLTSQLMTLYGNDEWMKSRTNPYSDTSMLLPTELFSFYCTEVSDRYLSQYVLQQCNTYINRSTLLFTRQ
jgi:hypothetical protein